MPSVATSFFTPSVTPAMPGASPAAASGFGEALASAVPAAAVEAVPAAAAVPLAGLATPATLTALNEVALPRGAVPTPQIATPASQATVTDGSARIPQPAILVVGGSKIPVEVGTTPYPAPATPPGAKPAKALPAILVAAPAASAGGAAPAAPTSAKPAVTAPIATSIAAPATPTPAIGMAEAPSAPAADAVETERRPAATKASDAATPLPDPATPVMPTTPGAAILVAAAPAPTPPGKPLPTAPVDAAPAETPMVSTPPAPDKPGYLRTQDPRAKSDGAGDPELLRAQERGAVVADAAPMAPVTKASASPTQKAGSNRKTDEAETPAPEAAQALNLSAIVAMPQPTPATVTHAPAPEPEAASKAPARAVAGAAGPAPAAAADPAPPQPAGDPPAPVDVAQRVASPVAAHSPTPDLGAAPAAAAPAAVAGPIPTAPTPPLPTASTPPPAARAAGTVTAEPGKIGREMGVLIARHAATGGGETITVRLDPKEMGRIDVRLSFDDDGRLRAVVAADNPAALDLLRRDSADLNRALVDAGVRADPQSLRFDTRSGGGDQAASGQSGQRREPPRTAWPDAAAADLPDDPDHQARTVSGRIDMMA